MLAWVLEGGGAWGLVRVRIGTRIDVLELRREDPLPILEQLRQRAMPQRTMIERVDGRNTKDKLHSHDIR